MFFSGIKIKDSVKFLFCQLGPYVCKVTNLISIRPSTNIINYFVNRCTICKQFNHFLRLFSNRGRIVIANEYNLDCFALHNHMYFTLLNHSMSNEI